MDPQGNFIVNAVENIRAGSPLTISLGDPTNPTPLFAKYGFLMQDCPTIFCKAIHLEDQIKELGYEFQELLFQTETGEIAPKVWDIFLYKILQDNDRNAAQTFYQACRSNNEEQKQQMHGQYFQYTLQALKDHVDGLLRDVDTLTNKAQNYNVRTHPRVPVIVAHNNLVKETFWNVQRQLQSMG